MNGKLSDLLTETIFIDVVFSKQSVAPGSTFGFIFVFNNLKTTTTRKVEIKQEKKLFVLRKNRYYKVGKELIKILRSQNVLIFH